MATQIYWNQEAYHIGMPRRSGRYKWGTGEDPYHHGADLPRGFRKKTRLERATKKKNIGMKTKRLISAQKKEYEKDPDAFRKKYYGNNASNKKIEKDFIERRKYADKYAQRVAKKEAKLKDKIGITNSTTLKKPTKSEKEDILNSGDATKVMKYKQFFSNEELTRAKTRLTLENDIAKISNEQIQNGSKKLSRMANTLDAYTSSIEKIGKSYDRVAKIYNAFSDKDAPKLPRIEGGNNNNNNNNNNNKNKAKEDSADINGKHYTDKPIKEGKNKKSGNINNLRDQNKAKEDTAKENQNKKSGHVKNLRDQVGRGKFASTARPQRLTRVLPTTYRVPSSYEEIVRKKYKPPYKWRKR